jgi:hypothetical protein
VFPLLGAKEGLKNNNFKGANKTIESSLAKTLVNSLVYVF